MVGLYFFMTKPCLKTYRTDSYIIIGLFVVQWGYNLISKELFVVKYYNYYLSIALFVVKNSNNYIANTPFVVKK